MAPGETPTHGESGHATHGEARRRRRSNNFTSHCGGVSFVRIKGLSDEQHNHEVESEGELSSSFSPVGVGSFVSDYYPEFRLDFSLVLVKKTKQT